MTETQPHSCMLLAAAAFRDQYGVASDRQIRAAGVSWERQQQLLRNGLWLRHSPGVLRVAGAPTTWHQRTRAATLMPGTASFVAAGAAGRVHLLDGCLAVEDIAVVIANSRRLVVPTGITVLRSRRLTAEDVTVVDGIPVVAIPLALLQLQVHGPNPEKALDSALRLGNRPDDLRAAFERWRGCGVQGPPEMLALLHDRAGARLPRSWFQRLAGRLLTEAGFGFVDELPVHDARGKLLAELDLANVSLKIGVECQSWEHHGSPEAMRADTRRKRRLRALGWEIVELWWSDLNRMDDVIADIRIAIDRAQIVNRAALPA